jgi:hypothetical protein
VFPRRLPLPTILTDNADKQIDEPCDERRERRERGEGC